MGSEEHVVVVGSSPMKLLEDTFEQFVMKVPLVLPATFFRTGILFASLAGTTHPMQRFIQ